MGIVRNPANTMRRGRVGETTYYISGGQQIARQALNGSNFGESARRSEAQQKRRVLWANLVNFYKASRGWMPKAFETKKRNQSDYNKFMQVNINSTTVALTKNEASSGACVVAPFLVSQGSLPSIAVTQNGQRWVTSIATGSLTISSTTTVAEFSAVLIAENGNIRAGQQLSFVSYQQNVDPLGTPRVVCRCYEVTIDTSNTEALYDSFPEFCASTDGGFLATSTNISVGGFAYILSELTSTGLSVSTQQLVVYNTDLLNRYTSDAQRLLAIASYGLDNEVILSPTGTVVQSPEAQPFYIASVTFGTHAYRGSDYVGNVDTFKGQQVVIRLSRPVSPDDAESAVHLANGSEFYPDVISSDGMSISGTVPSSVPSGIIDRVEVLDGDKSATISFRTSAGTGGDL